jgi:radical SAM protein with 4Fe4S-binding SPASM domain
VLDPLIYFHGCNAGDTVLGIEADGTIKSCPGLGSAYAGGNVRETRLREIWEKSEVMAFNRRRTSTICGASAARAITPRRAWPAARGPRMR